MQETRDASLIPWSGRSPGGSNGNPFQYSCLGNPMDRGAQQTTVHGVRVGHNWICMHAFIIPLLFSCSVVSNSLLPHGQQHPRLPCPSLSPGIFSNSSLLSQWCNPTISFSVAPFSSGSQSFPASHFFKRGGSLNQVAKVLELQLHLQSFPWIIRVDFF